MSRTQLHYLAHKLGNRQRLRQNQAHARQLLMGSILSSDRARLKILYGEAAVVLWDECFGHDPGADPE